MKVMNVAVVGAGIYGINHVNAYTWNPNTNLVAVCDLNKEITDKIAKQYEVKTYNDVNEMLDKEEIYCDPLCLSYGAGVGGYPPWETNPSGKTFGYDFRGREKNYCRSRKV